MTWWEWATTPSLDHYWAKGFVLGPIMWCAILTKRRELAGGRPWEAPGLGTLVLLVVLWPLAFHYVLLTAVLPWLIRLAWSRS